jgi:hypothetical protein
MAELASASSRFTTSDNRQVLTTNFTAMDTAGETKKSTKEPE